MPTCGGGGGGGRVSSGTKNESIKIGLVIMETGPVRQLNKVRTTTTEQRRSMEECPTKVALPCLMIITSISQQSNAKYTIMKAVTLECAPKVQGFGDSRVSTADTRIEDGTTASWTTPVVQTLNTVSTRKSESSKRLCTPIDKLWGYSTYPGIQT